MNDPNETRRQPMVRARVPGPLAVALAEAARRTGLTPSEIVRSALDVELTRLGVWPPQAEAP